MNDYDALEKDRVISQQLRITWPVFFDRFGRLTEVQRQAIPYLLNGEDVLVCAPTASGKTEAVCAPLVERYFLRFGNWRILYVSPTRALVNDLCERLFKPLSLLNFRVARYTGDHHDNLDNARILLTTPESFDSMLCRGKDEESGHILANVIAVVLDEIHFMLGNPRGEQLRWLLERLRLLRKFAKEVGWVNNDSIQIAAISATISNPDLVKKTYLGSEAKSIVVSGGRTIDTVNVRSKTPSTEDTLLKYIQDLTRPEKIIVFCNTRRRVDELSTKLKNQLSKLGYLVRAHHGSLSRNIREEAENIMKEAEKIVLFATSTLEIGIDIGDIDLIVLDGPAPSIQSLLQRIGRGNRRTNETRVMACAGNIAEVIIHSAMIECARINKFFDTSYGPCYSVARQQIASYIFQAPKRSRTKEKLLAFLHACTSQSTAEGVFEHLINEEEFIEDIEGIRLGQEWLDQSERGDIHSNIEGMLGLTVVDEGTGAQIAHGITFSGGNVLQIGGNLLKVQKWNDKKLEVRESRDKHIPDAAWSYCCRAWIKGIGQPYAVRDYLGFSEYDWPILKTNDQYYVFHFGGGRRKAIIEMILELNHLSSGDIKVNEWFLHFSKTKGDRKPEWISSLGPSMIEIQIGNKIGKLERSLGRPLSNKKLPMNLRIEEVRQWLQIERELQIINKSSWVNISDKDILNVMEILSIEIR